MVLAARANLISSRSSCFLASQALPSGVARNLRAWILRLLRFVAALLVAFAMFSPRFSNFPIRISTLEAIANLGTMTNTKPLGNTSPLRAVMGT